MSPFCAIFDLVILAIEVLINSCIGRKGYLGKKNVGVLNQTKYKSTNSLWRSLV